MEFSEDEELVLTQESVRGFNETQSSDYGLSIVEEDSVVSLENVGQPKFELI